MSTREAPKFQTPEITRPKLHPIDAIKSKEQPIWTQYELVSVSQIREAQAKDIGAVVRGEVNEVILAEVYDGWDFSEVGDSKSCKEILAMATFESMQQFGLSQSRQGSTVEYIDNHGCKKERTLYPSTQYLNLGFLNTRFISNNRGDRNLIAYSLWEAVWIEPKKDWVQGLLGRLNSIFFPIP